MSAVDEGAGYETPEAAVEAAGSKISAGAFIDTEVGVYFEVRDESGEMVEQLRLEGVDGRWLVAETKACFTG